jgi:hypothetical protein
MSLYEFARTLKKAIKVSAIITVGAWLVTFGILAGKELVSPQVVQAEKIVEVVVKEIPPVMERIAKCESGGTHYRNGQVIFNSNTNGSVDVGIYQINSVNFKDATARGFDVTKEADNVAYAQLLYAERGTEPWYSSKVCWNK